MTTAEAMRTGEGKQRGDDRLREADAYLRANPVAALLGAVVLGFAVGLIVRSLEKKPEPEPIRDALRELRTLISPFAKRTRQAYTESSEVVRNVVETAVEKAREVDVDRYAQPVNRWWQRLWA